MKWILKKRLVLLIGLLLVSISVPACTLNSNSQAPVEGLIYPTEVPASFEAIIAYRSVNADNAPVKYQWSADSGLIKGEGKSIIWIAPEKPGKYGVAVKITDAEGKETDRQVKIDVVPFSNNTINANPDIVLKVPSVGNAVDGLQVSMGPMTTAVISSSATDSDIAASRYTYTWSCNGGKMLGQGIKEGTASKIGWTSPGMAGNYTVKVTSADGSGNISIGHVYVNVKMPHCCEPAASEGIIQWKK